MIGVDGEFMGRMWMIYIIDYFCFYEKGFYVLGDFGVFVFEIFFGKIGVVICYD